MKTMIKPIPSTNVNKYYENEHVNKLVDISLEYLGDKIFLQNILTLLTLRDWNKIKHLIIVFKHNDKINVGVYENIECLFKSICYSIPDQDNLRGCVLELIIYKFLKQKYYLDENSSQIALDCYVEILGVKSKKTVDVFALCGQKGFICECKISHKNFDSHDVANLNQLYYDSFKILSPYIVTLAPQNFIERKLTEIALNDETNVWVHWNDLHIISIDNIVNFLS